jgi:hypothetical protein
MVGEAAGAATAGAGVATLRAGAATETLGAGAAGAATLGAGAATAGAGIAGVGNGGDAGVSGAPCPEGDGGVAGGAAGGNAMAALIYPAAKTVAISLRRFFMSIPIMVDLTTIKAALVFFTGNALQIGAVYRYIGNNSPSSFLGMAYAKPYY